MARFTGTLEWILVGAVIFGFGLALTYEITLPGFYYDEAIFLRPAASIYLGEEFDPLNNWCCVDEISGFRILLMDSTDYTSAVPAYLVLPFFAVFGVGVVAGRAMTAIFAMLALFFTYLLAKRLFGKETGLLAIILWATTPFFFEWTRVGLMASSTITFFSTSGLYFVTHWLDEKRDPFLYIGGFLLGVGASIKINFWWLLIGIASAWLVVVILRWGRSTPAELKRVLFDNKRRLFLLGISSAFGAYMLILHNLVRPLITLRHIFGSSQVSYYGVSNADFIANLARRIAQIETILGPLFFVAVFAGLLAIVLAVLYRGKRETEAALSIFVISLVSIIFSSFTITGLAETHLYVIFPFPIILAAYCLVYLIGQVRNLVKGQTFISRVLGLVGLAASFSLVLILISNVNGIALYLQNIETTGGQGVFSNAIYPLADYLVSRRESKIYAMDWGFKHNLALLSNLTVDPEEIYVNTNARDFKKSPDFSYAKTQLNSSFRNPDALYLFHSDEFTKFDMKELFAESASGVRKKVVLEHTFQQRDGKTVYLVYKLVPLESVVSIGRGCAHPNNWPFVLAPGTYGKRSQWIEAETATEGGGRFSNENFQSYGPVSEATYRWLLNESSFSVHDFEIMEENDYSIWIRALGTGADVMVDEKLVGRTPPSNSPVFRWQRLNETSWLGRGNHTLRFRTFSEGYFIYDVIVMTPSDSYIPTGSQKPENLDILGEPNCTRNDSIPYSIWFENSTWHVTWLLSKPRTLNGTVTSYGIREVSWFVDDDNLSHHENGTAINYEVNSSKRGGFRFKTDGEVLFDIDVNETG